MIILALLLFGAFVVNAQTGGMNCGDKDYECKIAFYSKAISANGGDAESYYGRGIAYDQSGEYGLALSDLDKYISLKPSKAEYLSDGYAGRGDVYRHTDKFALAIKDYTMALQLNPKSHSARLNRGIAYWKNNNSPSALTDFGYLIRQNSNDPEAYYNRSLVYKDQKKYRLAIADLDKYLSLDVTNNSYLADGYRVRGSAKLNSGDANGSLADFNRSIELNPDDAKTYRARAEAYRKLRKADLAAADEEKARDLGDQ